MTNSIKLGNVAHTIFDLYGFDATQIYCSVTGKPIGVSWDFPVLVESLSGDIEEIADDIAMRILASMRPSLLWNKMRVETIADLSISRPVETMAYLLNRLFMPKDTLGGSLPELNDRIKTYFTCAKLHSVGDSTERDILQMLLELDSKLSLKSIEPKFTAADFHACESWLDLLQFIGKLYNVSMDRWNRLMKESRFIQANPLAKRAFFDKVVADGFVKVKRDKTSKRYSTERVAETEASIKRREAKAAKQAEADFFAGLFEVVHDSNLGMEKQAKPIVAKPVQSVAPKVSNPFAFIAKLNKEA